MYEVQCERTTRVNIIVKAESLEHIFTFDDYTFSNPTSYLSTLKEDLRLRPSVWLNSYVAQSRPLFAKGKENSYFFMHVDTAVPTVWHWDVWHVGMAIVDFTKLGARTWSATIYTSRCISASILS